MTMRTPILFLALLGMTCAFSQSWVGLNYAAGTGECELDASPRDGITDGWGAFWSGQAGDSWQAEGIQWSLSSSRKLRGRFAQQITIDRNRDQSVRFVLRLPAIVPNRPPFIIPPQGTPLLVRAWYMSEGVSNVQAQVYVRSGSTRYLIGAPNPSQVGWQSLSAIVPFANNEQRQPVFYVEFEFTLGSGASRAQINIDSVEVLWTGYAQPQRSRPNPLKILHVNNPPTHHQVLLDPPADFIITDFGQIVSLSEYYTSIPLGVYVNVAQTTNRIPTPWDDLYGGYEFVLQNYPNWFLRDSSGNPFPNPGYPDLYPLDIGLAAVRQRAIQSFTQMVANYPIPEWFFCDNAGSWWQSQQYPTRTSILPRWTEYFAQVFSHVRNNLGRKIAINAGSHAGAFVDNNEGTRWIQYVDAVMLEHVITFWGSSNGYQYRDYRLNRATSPHTDSTWWATLRAVNAYPDKKWLLMCMSDTNNAAMIRYILASYFVMMHDNTYLMIDPRGSNAPNIYLQWVSRPEVWVPIGRPTGGWRVQVGTVADHTGALFARDFENGIVLVNPTPNQTYTYTLPRAYKNWDGEVVSQGTTITIPPRTGMVFYAAPEIVIEVAPQQITALPGETVTLRVICRNQGLQSGANLQVSVPLPEGLEFVSASDGGQLVNRQVRWNLTRLDAGQTRTLTFQARVQ
jgi:uncharacterized repeat protein (TIGR01451 family)